MSRDGADAAWSTKQKKTKVWERTIVNHCQIEAGNELLNYYRSIVRSETAVLARLNCWKPRSAMPSDATGEKRFITNLVSKPMTFMARYPWYQFLRFICGCIDAVKMLEDQIHLDFAITMRLHPHPKLHSHVERSHPLEPFPPQKGMRTNDPNRYLQRYVPHRRGFIALTP